MRELSLVELDMVVGGYSQDDVFDQQAYESVATAVGDDTYTFSVASSSTSQAEVDNQQAMGIFDGWEVTIGGTISNNPSITITAKKKC